MKKYIKFSLYRLFLKLFKVNPRCAYFESHASVDFAGNMYRIADVLLNGKFGRIHIYISTKAPTVIHPNVLQLKKRYPKAKITIVGRESLKNFYALSIAKYIFTDSSFIIPYEKRTGQVVVQTWHGTPLKKIGYDYVEDVAFTSNQKRAFAIADYCLFPNRYTMEHMIDSYRLENTMSGKILLGGYPRNSIFFDAEAAQALRDKLGLKGKRVYVYMPTWRGTLRDASQRKQQTLNLQKYLAQLDESLEDDQILFAKLHRLNQAEIDFSAFEHIRVFPTEYETYQFLAIADCLITDYSSVMFDFLCTRKKIILFAYDKQEYLQRQGTYMDFDALPFPQVKTIPELVEELGSPKLYNDDDAYAQFCPYDCAESAALLCDTVVGGKTDSCVILNPPDNQKENVLLYCGALTTNTTTLNFLRFLDQQDSNKENHFVTYVNTAFFSNPIRLQSVARPTNLIAIDMYAGSAVCLTVAEQVLLKLIVSFPWLYGVAGKKIDRMFKREIERQFWGIKWDRIIRYGGLDADSLGLMAFCEAKEKILLMYPETQKKRKEDKQFSVFWDLAEKKGYKTIQASCKEILASCSREDVR